MKQCPFEGEFNVTNPYPNCTNDKGLDLNTTQIIFNLIVDFVNHTGINDWRLNENGFPTLEGCISVTNTGASQPTWYRGDVVWDRLTSWKLPLLQLVFLTALPALAVRFRALVLSRLLGNPIWTIQDLILKLSDCQRRAQEWRDHLRDHGPFGSIPRTFRLRRRNFTWENYPSDTANKYGLVLPATTPLDESVDEHLATFQKRETLWKAITIIVISYDEFGQGMGHHVSRSIHKILQVPNFGAGVHAEFLAICLHAAEALAADRYTSIVPIVAAQIFFVFTIATPFIKIRKSGLVTQGVFLNIEAYSIAFSLLFFWIVFTTVLFAIVGVSQSLDRIPRILNRFQSDLQRLYDRVEGEVRRPKGKRRARRKRKSNTNHHQLDLSINRISGDEADRERNANLTAVSAALRKLLSKRLTLPNSEDSGDDTDEETPPDDLEANDVYQDTTYSGRIPSWQPGRWNTSLSKQDRVYSPSKRFGFWSGTFAIFTVSLAYLMGFAVASEVPPYGFSCRHLCITIMWGLWVANYFFSMITPERRRPLFWYHYIKDTLVAILEFVAIIVTQCGVLNSCACYTLWGRVGMALPQSHEQELYEKFQTTFARITFWTISAYYVIFPALVLVMYRDAARVFLQKDNGRSHSKKLQRLRFWIRERSSLGLGVEWLFGRQVRDGSYPLTRLDVDMIETNE